MSYLIDFFVNTLYNYMYGYLEILQVFLLHESLIALPESVDYLKNEIAKICELWFHKNFPAKDKLNFNVLIYLLQRTVLPTGTVSMLFKYLFAYQLILFNI